MKLLRTVAYVALIALGAQALLFSTVFVPVGRFNDRPLLFRLISSRFDRGYPALLILNWMVFSAVSLGVLIYALVRCRKKPIILPSVISLGLGAYILLCYYVMAMASLL